MRRAGAIAVLVAGVLVSLAAAYAAYTLANHSWAQITDYRSPYARVSLPPAEAGPSQSRRVVLVIVDGLTVAESRRMTGLDTLRQFGSDEVLTVPQPSLSYPNWTTILSGAPQRFSGVTTNSWKGRVPVETLLDTTLAAGRRVVVVGPWALEQMYGARRATGHYLRDYTPGMYLSSDLVSHTIDLVKRDTPSFVLLHLPDVDETGHNHGAASAAYDQVAHKVDADLTRLVSEMQDGGTTFVLVADHGHIATGGHGGWEPDVVHVPGVFAGQGVGLGNGDADLVDVAPTVAALLGVPSPRDATGRVLASVLTSPTPAALGPAEAQRERALAAYSGVVDPALAGMPSRATSRSSDSVAVRLADADAVRLGLERAARVPYSLVLAGAALALLAVIGLVSWRALVASLAGAATYYAVYDGLYFGWHGLAWSLSSINAESALQRFFAARIAEAVLGALAGALVAGLVYVALRRRPKGTREGHAAGWLSLGVATVLAVQATLAMQVAWYLWYWGAQVTWYLPDLRMGFKYDLDLLQATGLGIAALLAPVVTMLVGRYHPKVVRSRAPA